jgi:hypothetical protein
MAENATLPTTELIDHAAIDAALEHSFRELMLEHARMGRSVCESRDGEVVWITPVEIFARYGLDENGRPKPMEEPQPPLDPQVVARLATRDLLDKLCAAGRLAAYSGEHVIFANDTVFAHGPNLLQARQEAEAKAQLAGVSADELVDYFVPAE